METFYTSKGHFSLKANFLSFIHSHSSSNKTSNAFPELSSQNFVNFSTDVMPGCYQYPMRQDMQFPCTEYSRSTIPSCLGAVWRTDCNTCQAYKALITTFSYLFSYRKELQEGFKMCHSVAAVYFKWLFSI